MSPQDRVQNATRVIDFLLDIDPTTINVQDNEGNTPLHYAAQNYGQRSKQYTTILKLLSNRGADASILNKSETPLHAFFFGGSNYKPFHTDAIAILPAHGAKVTNKDDNGNTPLHLASSNLNQVDAISLLLQQGANPAMRNSKHETPLHRTAGGSLCRVKDINRMAAEKTEAQENILAKLVEVGGTTLMDLPNAEGKSIKQIFEERRKERKEQEDKDWLIRNGWG
ncbi:hypothetical protein FNYG_08777 [Fusarium nygamai]|uniref:Uncharacterized protein n=1 Tax=Gibberella nygamai TaxID=42673 RepID=A0A2K0W713_GIBNY|nr:hypothetical protein FNYG_08777 [Fusarium nygamai]